MFQAEGYSDGDLTLYHIFSVTEFLKAENPVDFLSKTNQVWFQNTSLIFQTSVCMSSNHPEHSNNCLVVQHPSNQTEYPGNLIATTLGTTTSALATA